MKPSGRNARRAPLSEPVLERLCLFGEERRRIKVIPHAFGERAVLKLMYAALIRASQTWRRLVISEFELKQIEDLRLELDAEFKERHQPEKRTSSLPRFPSKQKT